MPTKQATKSKIVLADDDELILQAYKDGLERAGYEVIPARDGAEALLLIEKHHPSLILLDLIMPSFNGFDVLKHIKSNKKLKDIPVAVLSNLSKATDEDEVRSLGAVEFLVKSDHSLKEIVAQVKSILGTTAK